METLAKALEEEASKLEKEGFPLTSRGRLQEAQTLRHKALSLASSTQVSQQHVPIVQACCDGTLLAGRAGLTLTCAG